MLHWLNRKELINVFSMREQARIREILSRNNIDYSIKTVNRLSPSPFSSGSRAHSGSNGQNIDLNYEYLLCAPDQAGSGQITDPSMISKPAE